MNTIIAAGRTFINLMAVIGGGEGKISNLRTPNLPKKKMFSLSHLKILATPLPAIVFARTTNRNVTQTRIVICVHDVYWVYGQIN